MKINIVLEDGQTREKDNYGKVRALECDVCNILGCNNDVDDISLESNASGSTVYQDQDTSTINLVVGPDMFKSSASITRLKLAINELVESMHHTSEKPDRLTREYYRDIIDNMVFDDDSAIINFLVNCGGDLLAYFDIPEDVMEKHADLFGWDSISKYGLISAEFIWKHENELNWKLLSRYQPFSIDMLHEFKHKIKWKQFSKSLSVYRTDYAEILTTFSDYIDWDIISQNIGYHIGLLRKFRDKLNWKKCAKFTYDFSMDELWEFRDVIDWKKWVRHVEPTPEYINKFKDYILLGYLK